MVPEHPRHLADAPHRTPRREVGADRTALARDRVALHAALLENIALPVRGLPSCAVISCSDGAADRARE